MNVLMNQIIYLNYKKMIVQNIQLFIYQFINSLDSKSIYKLLTTKQNRSRSWQVLLETMSHGFCSHNFRLSLS